MIFWMFYSRLECPKHDYVLMSANGGKPPKGNLIFAHYVADILQNYLYLPTIARMIFAPSIAAYMSLLVYSLLGAGFINAASMMVRVIIATKNATQIPLPMV